MKLNNPRPTPVGLQCGLAVMTPSAELVIHTRSQHTSASQNLLPHVSGKQIIPRFVSVYSEKVGPKQQEMGPREKEGLQGTEGNLPQIDH